MNWYVVHTKPRQESRALLNLERQGYECFLPTITKKKVGQSALELITEPLFSRYLFISLDTDLNSKSWSPIRSTLGVSKLVTFGSEPAKVHTHLIAQLRDHEADLSNNPQSPFQAGDIVTIRDGAFAGIEAVYQMDDGEARAMVLIELLHRPTRMAIPITNLQRAS
jgi:transcriptional antiterminator RfaH